MDAFHTTADNSWGLEPLIDVGELATYLGIPVSTIYDWRTRGLGPPAYRFGIHLKFAVSDVRDWILYTDETPLRSGPLQAHLLRVQSCDLPGLSWQTAEARGADQIAGGGSSQASASNVRHTVRPSPEKACCCGRARRGGVAATSSTGRFGAGLPFIESDDADALWW